MIHDLENVFKFESLILSRYLKEVQGIWILSAYPGFITIVVNIKPRTQMDGSKVKSAPMQNLLLLFELIPPPPFLDLLKVFEDKVNSLLMPDLPFSHFTTLNRIRPKLIQVYLNEL